MCVHIYRVCCTYHVCCTVRCGGALVRWAVPCKFSAAQISFHSLTQVLYADAPVMWFKPLQKQDLKLYPHYECPLYKVREQIATREHARGLTWTRKRARTHVHMHTHTHTHTHTYTHTHTRTRTHACTHTCTHARRLGIEEAYWQRQATHQILFVLYESRRTKMNRTG